MDVLRFWLCVDILLILIDISMPGLIIVDDDDCQNLFYPNCSCISKNWSPSVQCPISNTTLIRINYDDDPEKKTADLIDYTVFMNETFDLPEDLLKPPNPIKMSITLSGLKSLQASVCTSQSQLVYLDVNKAISLKTIDSKLLSQCSVLKMLRISDSQVEDFSITRDKTCTLEDLILTNNKIRSISNELMHWCTHLNDIDLSGNEISHLPSKFFSTCNSLLSLSLSNNNISEFEPQVFSDCENLADLDLSGNSIRILTDLIPGSKSHIRFLNLKQNKLQQLPEQVFASLEYLQEINLNYNNIKSTSHDIFGDCNNLRLLLLEGNNLTTFPINVIEKCSVIYTLELSNNQLTSISNHSLPSSLRNFGLSYNKLNDLPVNLMENSSKLEILLLNGNQLINLPSNLLLTSSYLKKIDLSNNQLKSIPPSTQGACLNTLDISNNQIMIYNLSSNPSKSYKISFNKIEVLTAPIFDLECYATVLDASNNQIKKIQQKSTIGLQKLVSLDLSYNQIENLTLKNVFLLDNLQNFNLANNKLTSIEDGLFSFMYQLVNLKLNNNPIHHINSAHFTPISIINNIKNDFICASQNLIPFIKTSLEITRKNKCQFPSNCKCEQIKHLFSNTTCTDKQPRVNVTCDSQDCPQKCQCTKVNNEIFVDCNDANVTSIPKVLPANTTIVYLENNLLKLSDSESFNHSSWTFVVYIYMSNSLTKGENILNGRPFSNLGKTVQLDLSQNMISSIASGVFKGLGQLKNLDLSENEISSLSTKVFLDITNLEVIDLSSNKLDSLQLSSLSVLSNLKHVILKNNQITRMSGNYWQIPSTLIFLDLKYNKISSLNFLFQRNLTIPSNLNTVDLRYNELQDINITMESMQQNFLKLHLGNNMIEKMHLSIINNTNISGILQLFLENNDLLCDCHLTNLLTTLNSQNSNAYLTIEGAECQKPIFLKNKVITSLDPSNLLCLETQDCPNDCQCYNNRTINGIVMDCCNSKFVQLPIKAPSNIYSLYIRNLSSVITLEDPSWITLKEFYLMDKDDSSKTDFQALKNFSNIQRVEIDDYCWCRIRSYTSYSFTPISGTCDQSLPSSHCIRNELNNATWNRIECTSSFMPQLSYSKIPYCPVYEDCDECYCYLDSASSLVMNCSNKQMNHFPFQRPKDVNILDMNYNLLTTLPDLSQWPHLNELYVRNNSIETIDDVREENLPSKLKLVTLDNNRLKRPSGWLNEIMKTTSTVNIKLSLMGNPLECDCDKPNFSRWPRSRVSVLLIKPNETLCYKSTGKSYPLPQTLQCTESNIELIIGIILVLLSILAIIAIILALYFKYRRSIHVFLLSHDLCLCLFKEQSFDNDIEYKFDAFLSYSSEDSDIIVDALLPGLEAANFTVCVHERDWLGGQFISEQIAHSVQTSRRTIIVLSEAFLRSPWATLEFKMALQKALEDRFNRIIVVVPDKLPNKDQMDPDLRSFVTMNTYLFLNDKRFWDKMKYAMPRKLKEKGKAPLRKLPQSFVELMTKNKPKRESINSSTELTEIS